MGTAELGGPLRALGLEPGESRVPVGVLAGAGLASDAQAARTGSGTLNGGWSQPASCLASASTSSPSGEPCAFAVPSMPGAPWPITVRTAMKLGRGSAFARVIARSIASTSVPSGTASVCHP